jgi:hypothetical protein
MPGGTFGGISFLVWGYIAPKCGSEGKDGNHGYGDHAGEPQQRSYSISDSGGLHLMISPAGGKLWRWSTAFRAKKS